MLIRLVVFPHVRVPLVGPDPMICPVGNRLYIHPPESVHALPLPTVPELSLARSASLFSGEYNVDSALIRQNRMFESAFSAPTDSARSLFLQHPPLVPRTRPARSQRHTPARVTDGRHPVRHVLWHTTCFFSCSTLRQSRALVPRDPSVTPPLGLQTVATPSGMFFGT